jgi:hypothetical protein
MRHFASTSCRLAIALGLTALAACSTMDVKTQAVDATRVARIGPEQAPFHNITGFTPALRCMDDKLLDFGVRDVTMLVEDIFDQTKKVNAGTRDMLISAVSDMTRRSRAIRINAFGRDSANAISFLASAQRQLPYETVPQFDIKGSVSQFDENMIRSQQDAGLGIKPFINLGVSVDAATSILGLDLSVMTTEDLLVQPGVTSRNSVAILKQGKGADADAAYHKFGVSYSMSLSRSEGSAQALRGLVELAVIELVGKLTKTPYWSCLGADAGANEEIKLEISDWYHAMAATRIELIAYFQHQMRRRGFYQGPVDGKFNPAIDEAIANYRVALGLSKEALIDPAFFSAYLNADHSKITRPGQPAIAPAAAQGVVPAPATSGSNAQSSPPGQAASSLGLALSTANKRTTFARGEPISLLVTVSRDAQVYCYLEDENRKVLRFFPNRFQADARVKAASALVLPGDVRYRLYANEAGRDETIACFAIDKDMPAQLPASVIGTDLEPLNAASLETVKQAFEQVAHAGLAKDYFHVKVR